MPEERLAVILGRPQTQARCAYGVSGLLGGRRPCLRLLPPRRRDDRQHDGLKVRLN